MNTLEDLLAMSEEEIDEFNNRPCVKAHELRAMRRARRPVIVKTEFQIRMSKIRMDQYIARKRLHYAAIAARRNKI